ncbi:DUF262 domain-containing protein [Paenibacillus sp. FSL R7-0333]|uniref:DUF262 domain-containing protein n=1 Tax=Paenibacillus sp. FSL R7-0333 TaxID=1926587 RepID=UPI00096D9BDE|nr:hypothetical protein BK146_28335 [Paenibacillus sp. FSL R7-0333]
MSLQEEINTMSRVIMTDSYPMSIGELTNIYKEGDMDLHPEFQRIFRWDIKQKSNLIESILLGIPIPPIFVYQTKEGVWDVIDGLQRLSTIFEFMGILKDDGEDGEVVTVPASKLIKTKFLPSLNNKMWENEDVELSLDEAQRRFIKRAKLDIKIIEKSSDSNAKYELFQRLNTGGTHLSPQEIRNCLLVMINKNLYNMIKELSDYKSFTDCLPLSDNNIEQQNDMELIVRFIVARHSDLEALNRDDNIHEYLTERITQIAQENTIDLELEKAAFIQTFDYLNELLGDEVFKKYYENKGRYEGAVLISSYEAIVLGVSKNLEDLKAKNNEEVIDMIKALYSNSIYVDSTKRGARPLGRFKNLSKLSLEYFKV